MSSSSLETALNQGIYNSHYTLRGLSSQGGANCGYGQLLKSSLS